MSYVILKSELIIYPSGDFPQEKYYDKGRYTMVQTSFLKELIAQDNIHNNLSVPELVEKILCLNEGTLSSTGAIRTSTGEYTGRSPKDRYIVKDDVSEDLVDWGQVNKAIDETSFDRLYKKVVDYLKEQDELFSFKGFAGADE